MAPKKVTRGEKPKRKIVISKTEMKKELITKRESGTRLSDLADKYSTDKSTIPTVMGGFIGNVPIPLLAI
jgi:hypothetical protein